MTACNALHFKNAKVPIVYLLMWNCVPYPLDLKGDFIDFLLPTLLVCGVHVYVF